MPVKYKKYYKDLLEREKELFVEFKKVHDAFDKDPEKWKNDFNRLGSEVLLKLKKTENSLCARSELSKYAKYSTKLADKVWLLARKNFPKIDMVDNTQYAQAIETVTIDDLL